MNPTIYSTGTKQFSDSPASHTHQGNKGHALPSVPVLQQKNTPSQPSLSNDPQPVTQLMTVGTIYKTTDDKTYRTKKGEFNYVGVKGGAAPKPEAWIVATGDKTSGYDAYAFHGPKFENDCLGFATKLGYKIANQKITKNSMMRIVVDDVTTDINFAEVEDGYKDTDTGAADGDYGNFKQNNQANPEIGQAYAIVPKTGATLDPGTCNFHIAAVVAKAGSDTVTCEADAGAVRKEPVFDMYSTDLRGRMTFHSRYKDTYGGKYAVTGIIAV